MNDLERELMKLLDEKVREVPAPSTAPERVLRHTRRRQLATVAAGGAAAILVVAGSILGVRAILGGNEQIPADRSVETADGVTITIPRGWSLVPCEDLTPEQRCFSSEEEAPAFVLSNGGVASTDLGCPAEDDTFRDTVFLLVQNQRLATEGPWAAPWPIDFEPVDAPEDCFAGWSFFNAGWTEAERTFYGFVAIAPGASDPDRDDLLDAFASMSFGPSTRTEQPALATGVTAGEEWRLVESGSDAPLTLDLYFLESRSAGFGFADPNKEFAWHVFGEGEDAVALVFGAITKDITHVRLAGSSDEARIIEPVQSDWNVFLLEIEAPVDAEIILLIEDAQGHVAREPLTLLTRSGKILNP
jgi:hypothetical protein